MPATYTLIASNTLGSDTASITFSSIPGTYTDLVLRCSVRGTRVSNTVDIFYAEFNGDTATNYSNTDLTGTGSAAASARASSNTVARLGYIPASTSTADTFSNTEVYIPSYTVAQNKPNSNFGVQENNNATAYIEVNANLWRNTAAITSIKLLPGNASFKSGSSFFLYGIKNS